jgi:hypothetical protein
MAFFEHQLIERMTDLQQKNRYLPVRCRYTCPSERAGHIPKNGATQW